MWIYYFFLHSLDLFKAAHYIFLLTTYQITMCKRCETTENFPPDFAVPLSSTEPYSIH